MNFCLLLKKMGKNVGKNINKNLRGKYREKSLHHVQPFTTDALECAEATDDLINNKTANKITAISTSSPQNNAKSEIQITEERYISSLKRQ